MSEYNDDDDVDDGSADPVTAQPPPDETPIGSFTATLTREEIVRAVAGRFYADFAGRYGDGDIKKAADQQLRKMVRKRIEPCLDAIVEEAVRSAAADLVENGWEKTDGYGRPSGKVTVKSLTVERLTSRDSYNRESRLDALAEKVVAEAMKAELGPLLDEAKTKARAVLADKFDAALRKALLEGAGLRA